MKGIDFVVKHKSSARLVISILVGEWGFISPEGGISGRTKTIRADFSKKYISIYSVRSLKSGSFRRVLLGGRTVEEDRDIVERAMRNSGRGVGFDHRIIDRPILGHGFKSRSNHHIDAMGYLMERKMFENRDSLTSFKNSFSKEVSKLKFKDMQITKTEKIKINDKIRNVTIVVLNEGKKVKAGYSICMPQDKVNDELGGKIALGRAKNERTNLVDMELGKGLDRKFIMYAIAEDLLRKIERGIIKIKGVK